MSGFESKTTYRKIQRSGDEYPVCYISNRAGGSLDMSVGLFLEEDSVLSFVKEMAHIIAHVLNVADEQCPELDYSFYDIFWDILMVEGSKYSEKKDNSGELELPF